jgi:hypothetical protein
MAILSVGSAAARLLTAAALVTAILAAAASPRVLAESVSAGPDQLGTAADTAKIDSANSERASKPIIDAKVRDDRALILGLLIVGSAAGRPFGPFK